MNSIVVPRGWKLLRNGTRERPTDRFRFRAEGGCGLLSRWSPLGDAAKPNKHHSGKVLQHYLTIRKDA